MIIMLLILFDLGRAVLDYSVLENAVREGTRYAIVQPGGGSNSAIQQQVEKSIYAISDFDPSAIVITHTSTTVSVQVHYVFKPILSGIMSAIGFSTLTINANSQMVLSPYAQ